MIALQMGFREKHPVTHLVFSPDQSVLAVAQPHCGVTLVERASGRTVAVRPLPRRGALTGLAFTGDGRLLVAASAKGVSAFAARTGAPVASRGYGVGCATLLATMPCGVLELRPDGWRREHLTAALLAQNFDRPWNIERLFGKAVAADPGGRLALVARSLSSVALLDLARGRVTARLGRPEAKSVPYSPLPVAQFCPVGRRVAVNDGATLDVYDLAETPDEDEPADAVPAPRAVLEPTFALRSEKAAEARSWHPPFALLADGRGLLVKRPRNRVQLWDAPANALVAEWSWRLEWVTCLAAAPDGLTAAAGGRFGRVLLWDLD